MFRRRPSPDELAAAKRDLAEREDPYNVTQASHIYFLPNLMTAGNLFCGFLAIVNCIQARLAETSLSGEYLGASNADHYRFAVWFIFGAAVCDALDGRLARMGGRASLFGAEFDSIADVVSFGVAPTLLMFYLILSPTQGIIWFRNVGWAIGFIYLLCAAMRLARFNVITNPLLHAGEKDSGKDFVGLPVPAAAGTVAGARAAGSHAAHRAAHDEPRALSERKTCGSADAHENAALHRSVDLHRAGGALP